MRNAVLLHLLGGSCSYFLRTMGFVSSQTNLNYFLRLHTVLPPPPHVLTTHYGMDCDQNKYFFLSLILYPKHIVIN